MELGVGLFVGLLVIVFVGLLVIVMEELICLLFPRVAGRPLPGLLATMVVVLVGGASRSTAMMSFTELMMSFLFGWYCLTDRINCF